MMKRILYVVPSICGYGGIARTLINKANYWYEHFGYEVIFIVFYHPQPITYALNPNIRVIDLQLNLYQEPIVSRLLNVAKLIYRVRKLIYEIQPDYTISIVSIKETSWLWRMKDGSRKILESHGAYSGVISSEKNPLKRLSNYLTKKSILHSDKFVVLTHKDAESYRKFCSPLVIPNANPIAPSRQALLQNKKVISIGSLFKWKNHKTLIDIWGKLRQEFPDWQLYIFGAGDQQEALLTQISKLQLNGCVHIAYTSDAQQEYLDAALFAFPSLYEGLPMVLLEANACGVPSIAFDIDCGPSEVIDDGVSGFVIPKGDTDLFMQDMAYLMKNTEARLRMGQAAYEKSKEFDNAVIMKKWQELFETL